MADSHCTEGAAPSKADWMASLPPSFHDAPLKKLCVPGTHNSASFWLDCDSPPSPACPPLISNLCALFGPGTRQIVRNWSACQTLTWTQQLEAGIRYMDLRTTTKPDSTDIYYEHSLYGNNVNQSFLDIHKFLETHKKEVIFLDFNHFTEFSDEAHERFISLIRSTFGPMLCPVGDMKDITLSKLWESNKRVLVFYHHQTASKYADLWPGGKIPSPWVDDDDATKLISFIEAGSSKGLPNDTFHVTQCIITPSPNTIMGHMTTGLQDYVVAKVAPQVTEWIKSKQNEKVINICIADFVEHSDFVDCVLAVNRQ